MSRTDAISDTAASAMEDTRSQIASLRRQIETLMSDRVNPAISDAAHRADRAARQASGYTREQAQVLSGKVQNQPLTAVVVAAGIGFLLGRLFRL